MQLLREQEIQQQKEEEIILRKKYAIQSELLVKTAKPNAVVIGNNKQLVEDMLQEWENKGLDPYTISKFLDTSIIVNGLQGYYTKPSKYNI